MTITEKINKLGAVLKGIGRDADGLEDYEAADSIGRSVQFALQLLEDVTLDSQPEATDDLLAA